MELKKYQQHTLDVLRDFLREARIAGPAAAYHLITKEPEQAKRLGRYCTGYKPLDALPGVPYVCLRLPTGGGKTILGAYSIGLARDALIEKDYPLVLWLVPTNTIRLQTVEALKNPRHPYRRVLDETFDGKVRVFDIADFTHVRPQDIRANCCLVVGTIQTLRVTNTEGRKVYAHHEDMEPHFANVPDATPGLERAADGQFRGKIKFSFANLMHLHRPLMIVDEAHNAVTGLTREMQTRVNPCAIIEFTATPKLDSNILHNVTAQELKQEEMIKLPVVLAEHANWQAAVNGAVASRAALAGPAAADKENYIRPIVLFQAQPRDEEVTVEALKKHLIEIEQIPEDRIAVATGDQRQLDGIDLFDPKCPIEHVITVEALKEGWDCSFAYVFCSVANIRSAASVEQLLGRVLRMPYAKRRAAKELNKAYAHISEPSFSAAAQGLYDKLVAMGFDDTEAKEAIEPAQGHFDETELFGPRERPTPVFRHRVKVSEKDAATLREKAGGAVTVTEKTPGEVEIAVTGRVSPEIEKIIAEIIPTPERAGFGEAVRNYRVETRDQLSFAEQGEPFVAPRLMTEVQGTLRFADVDLLMEDHDWSLLAHSPKLSEGEFAVRETAHSFEFDLDGKTLTYRSTGPEEQLLLDMPVEGWTAENLVFYLDRNTRQPDILQSELLKWLRDCVTHLTQTRGISLTALWRGKFKLAEKIQAKLSEFRQKERDGVYQKFLFAPEAKPEVSFEKGFKFFADMYWDQRSHRYTGPYRFSKHYLGNDKVPAFSGVDEGEEFQCAQALDSLNEVKFWIRNVSQHKNSFWLPRASQKTYPDFVAMLTDGRIFVVEYKGAHLAGEGNPETNEKRMIGALWERRSEGKGLFLMVEKEIDGKDMRTQMLEKIAARGA
jgi:type III restriction enzyme